MPTGYCYEASNEYIIRKLKKFAEASKTQYSIFGHYIVTEKELDFKKFKFIPRKYYLRRLGKTTTNENKWLNNEFESVVDYTSEIFKYCFKLKKCKNNKILLFIKDKKYKLEYTLHIIRYFYKKTEKEFFEKDYNIAYLDDKMMTNNELFSDDADKNKPIYNSDLEQIENFENKFDAYNEEEHYISSYTRKKNATLDLLRILSNDNLNFDVFYEHYFVNLTENQQKIVALHLLDIRQRDIARLLGSSQIYALLEIKRIGKKIAKIYNKKRIKFWGDCEEAELDRKDNDDN